MPGEYSHTVTVMGMQDGSMGYQTDTKSWRVLAMASNYTVTLSEHIFVPEESKSVTVTVDNEGGELSALILSFPINRRFSYEVDTFTIDGHEEKTYSVRYEGGSMYIELPADVTVPAGGQLVIRFQCKAI